MLYPAHIVIFIKANGFGFAFALSIFKNWPYFSFRGLATSSIVKGARGSHLGAGLVKTSWIKFWAHFILRLPILLDEGVWWSIVCSCFLSKNAYANKNSLTKRSTLIIRKSLWSVVTTYPLWSPIMAKARTTNQCKPWSVMLLSCLFFSWKWVTETLQANKRKHQFFIGSQRQLFEGIFHKQQSSILKGKILLCFLTVADFLKLQHAISQNGWS